MQNSVFPIEIKIHSSYDEKWEMAENVNGEIEFFNPSFIECRFFIAAYYKNSVIGLVCLTESSYRMPNSFGVAYISVQQDYKNKGIAKQLVDELFSHANSNNKNICNTPYEPEGEKFLRHIMERTSKKFPKVILHERY